MLCCYIAHPGPQADVVVLYCSSKAPGLMLWCSIAYPGPQADVVVLYCSSRAQG